MGEKQDGRRIIDNATERMVRGGMPAEKALARATAARIANEAKGDVPRVAVDHRRRPKDQD